MQGAEVEKCQWLVTPAAGQVPHFGQFRSGQRCSLERASSAEHSNWTAIETKSSLIRNYDGCLVHNVGRGYR